MKKENSDLPELDHRQLHEKVRLLEKENYTLLQELKSCREKEAAELPLKRDVGFSELLDALPTPAYITDGEGRLTHFNPAAVEFAGRVPELGKDQWCVSWKLFYPDGKPMPHDECPMAIALKEGRTIQGAEGIAELPDGTRRGFTPFPKPLFDSDGKVVGGINILVDITERKQVEKELIHQRELLQGIFDNLPVLLVLWNPRLKRFTLNPHAETLLGWTTADANKGNFMRKSYPDPTYRAEVIKYMQSPQSAWREWNVTTKDGQIVPIEWANIRLTNDTMIAIGVDLREHKQAEEALRKSREEFQKAKESAEKATRVKSEFLANMSHEIRTPMTVFLAALENLLKLDDEPEHLPWLKMADKSAQHLRSLIDDILDFSRIEARQVEIKEESFRLHPCIQNVMDMLRLSATEKDLALKHNISPEAPEMVTTDRDRLSQVLMNLVGNAVKFTERGEVEVSVRVDDQCLLFSVRDTGSGIPEEKKVLLFRSFSQVDGSHCRKQDGTGLGLAICKGLVELMGGDIWVESCPGEGSTFSFALPLKKPAVNGELSPQEVIQKHDDPEKGLVRILLAEDEPMIQNMISMILAQRGHQIETAANGQEAVDRWQEGNFDLILMDMQMPEMNGIEAAYKIRRLEKEKDMNQVPIVALSADVRTETREKCQAAGMDGFLSKPINFEALYDVVEKT